MYEERSSLDKEHTCETLNVSMNQEIIIIIRDVMIVSWFIIKSRINIYRMIWYDVILFLNIYKSYLINTFGSNHIFRIEWPIYLQWHSILIKMNFILNFYEFYINPFLKWNFNRIGTIITGVQIKPMVVVEGDFLHLYCHATGQPRPDIVWTRSDGRPITDGAWQGKYI